MPNRLLTLPALHSRGRAEVAERILIRVLLISGPPMSPLNPDPLPASGRAIRGKLDRGLVVSSAPSFASKSPLPGLVPGIHVLTQPQCAQRRRGWPGQARPWGYSLVAHERSLATEFDSPDSPAACGERP